MAEESFADKCRWWRENGLQVAARGIPGKRERITTAPDGHKVREVYDPDSRASIYHHSNDDTRQDVTVRPQTAHLKLGG